MAGLRNLNRSYAEGRVCGTPYVGVLGSEVPGSGDAGAGYVYNDLSLPADASKRVCGRVTTWPTNGDLYAYEDSSFTYDGATDSFFYQLYVDGVAVGSPVEVDLVVSGASCSFSVTAGGAVFSGSAQQKVICAFDLTAEGATFSGSAGFGTYAFCNFTAEGATFSGSAESIAGCEFNFTAEGATFSGSAGFGILTTADLAAIAALVQSIVDAGVNVGKLNGATLYGSGTIGDKWRGTP